MGVKPNEVLGGFAFAQSIGEGTTGAVWLARERESSLPVAIKLLKPAAFPPAMARTMYEALIGSVTRVGRFQHPNLVETKTTFHLPVHGLYGVVSEYLDGKTVERIRLPRAASGASGVSDPRVMANVLEWFQKLVSTLSWLHTNRIVHGNVKASNVMLLSGQTTTLKLLDLAWSHAEIPLVYPDERSRAPEVNAGGKPTPASDQWGAAKILHDLIVSSSPDQSPARALAFAPPSLLRIVQKALHTDPRQRFGDMGALFHAIEEARGRLNLESALEIAHERAPSQRAPRPISNRPPPMERKPPKDRPLSLREGPPPIERRPSHRVPEPRGMSPTDAFFAMSPRDTIDTDAFNALSREAIGPVRRFPWLALVAFASAAVVAFVSVRTFGPTELEELIPSTFPSIVTLTSTAVQTAPIREVPPPPPVVVKEPEPIKAEPIKTEPIKTEPIKAEPVKAEPIKERVVEDRSFALQRDCEAGKLTACLEAGEHFEQTNGKLARRVYERACDRHNATACQKLANLYAEGVGGPKNARNAKAFRYRACAFGLKSACN